MTGVSDAARTAESYFHLHLVSDSTGETLISVGGPQPRSTAM
jgi:hypothetical protein